MSSALSRLLTDFNADMMVRPANEDEAIISDFSNAMDAEPESDGLPSDLMAAGGGVNYDVVRSAYKAGIEKGRSENEEMLAALREEGVASTEAAVEAAKQELLAGTLQPLANDLSASYAQLGESIERGVAEVLAPLLNQELKRQALQSLKDSIEELMGDQTDAPIKITAPENMVEELAVHLAPLADAASIVSSDSDDIEVRLDDTILNTKLGQLQGIMQEIFD